MSIVKDDCFKTIRASFENSVPQSSAAKEDDEVIGCDDNDLSTFNEDKMSIDSDQLLKNVKNKFTTINQYDSVDLNDDRPGSKIQSREI